MDHEQPPLPQAPTALLWGEQIKRQHKHLAGRVDAMEARSSEQEARIRSAEAEINTTTNNANKYEEKINAIVERFNETEAWRLEKRVTDLDSDTNNKLNALKTQAEVTATEISTLHANQKAATERFKAVTDGVDARLDILSIRLEQYYELAIQHGGDIMSPEEKQKMEKRLQKLRSIVRDRPDAVLDPARFKKDLSIAAEFLKVMSKSVQQVIDDENWGSDSDSDTGFIETENAKRGSNESMQASTSVVAGKKRKFGANDDDDGNDTQAETGVIARTTATPGMQNEPTKKAAKKPRRNADDLLIEDSFHEITRSRLRSKAALGKGITQTVTTRGSSKRANALPDEFTRATKAPRSLEEPVAKKQMTAKPEPRRAAFKEPVDYVPKDGSSVSRRREIVEVPRTPSPPTASSSSRPVGQGHGGLQNSPLRNTSRVTAEHVDKSTRAQPSAQQLQPVRRANRSPAPASAPSQEPEREIEQYEDDEEFLRRFTSDASGQLLAAMSNIFDED